MGKVSKGLSKAQIDKIPCRLWRAGVTNMNTCSICQEEFVSMQKFKKLTECGHEYHDTCINKWLKEEKRCPVCNKNVIE